MYGASIGMPMARVTQRKTLRNMADNLASVAVKKTDEPQSNAMHGASIGMPMARLTQRKTLRNIS